MTDVPASTSRRAEFAIVVVMALGFGLVGIDRFLISSLFPLIAHDLKLDYGDIGTITGVLALAWGGAALLMGNLSDRIGRRVVLVGALLLFSLLIGASGLATSLAGLIAVRVVMGFADGAYTPVSIVATLEASPPKRHGLNIGIQQMMLPLFGLGFAPLIVARLLQYIDWRYIFSVFALPGLVLALAVALVIPKRTAVTAPVRSSFADWREVLRYPNIRLGMALMLCWLTCLITTSALLPNYLIDHLHLSFTEMTTVMSAIGIGSAVGTIALPWLSDRVGRNPVMIVSTIGAAASLALLADTGPNASALFAFLFVVHFFNNALITLTVGPLCAETVPPMLMATASGVVIATGELFGGGIAPIIGGQVALHFGIGNILWLPLVALAMGFLLCLLLKETNPRFAKPATTSGGDIHGR
jgi:predicted MFS family arabinose efflux permease